VRTGSADIFAGHRLRYEEERGRSPAAGGWERTQDEKRLRRTSRSRLRRVNWENKPGMAGVVPKRSDPLRS